MILQEMFGETWNIQSTAEFLADVNDDILPQHYLDIDYSLASEEQCWELIKRVCHSGSCEEFALAVANVLGYPPLRVVDQATGNHHVVNRDGDHLFDVTGYVSFREIARRYGMAKPAKVEVNGHMGSGWLDEDMLDVFEEIVRHIPWKPFR